MSWKFSKTLIGFCRRFARTTQQNSRLFYCSVPWIKGWKSCFWGAVVTSNEVYSLITLAKIFKGMITNNGGSIYCTAWRSLKFGPRTEEPKQITRSDCVDTTFSERCQAQSPIPWRGYYSVSFLSCEIWSMVLFMKNMKFPRPLCYAVDKEYVFRRIHEIFIINISKACIIAFQ